MGCSNEAHRPSPLPSPPKRRCPHPKRYSSWHKVHLHPPLSTPHLTSSRTDKKQHFSEKVTKVESILAADGKAEKKIVEVKPDERPKKVEEAKESKTEEQRQPLTPATNQGTWASMFRK
jgi:hypothetical protein